ncbi:MAG: hypothetical protein WBA77_19070 [Microcoleaceae cyanobacterium]
MINYKLRSAFDDLGVAQIYQGNYKEGANLLKQASYVSQTNKLSHDRKNGSAEFTQAQTSAESSSTTSK